MYLAPLPQNESERLAALDSVRLAGADSSQQFDVVTRLAVQLFDVSDAFVSFMEHDTQWVVASTGRYRPGTRLPRGISFCGHLFDGAEGLVVEDAARDARFADNPHVLAEDGFRFYAGHVIRAPSGHALGTLCVIDACPRPFPEASRGALRDLAAILTAEVARHVGTLALREAEARYRDSLEMTPHGRWIADGRGDTVDVNSRWLQLLDAPQGETRSRWLRALHDDDRSRVVAAWEESLRQGTPFAEEYRLRIKGRGHRWYRAHAIAVCEAGRDTRWYGTVEDVHERKMAELAALESAALNRAITENNPDGVEIFDRDGWLRFCNQVAARAHGREIDAAEQPGRILRRSWFDRWRLRDRARLLQAMRGALSGPPQRLTLRAPGEAADASWWDVVLCRVPTEHGTADCLMAVSRDITEAYTAHRRIRHMLRHDQLTGLRNRHAFDSQLQRMLSEPEAAVAVIWIDIDRFRAINDTRGHVGGDAVLVAVADRLRRAIAVLPGSPLARMGGDEFIVAVPLAQDDALAVLEHAASRLLGCFDTPFEVGGHSVAITASAGMALAPRHGSTATALYTSADLALNRVKSDMPGTARLFDVTLGQEELARQALRLELREALRGDELCLVYQPIVEVGSGRVVRYEALMRWRHPRRGMVPPSLFIPIAEESGLIRPIGEWALQRACRDAARWSAGWPVEQGPAPGVAVNLSVVQFRGGGIAEAVANALARSGLRPDLLELEVTETVLFEDDAAVLEQLNALKALNVRLAIDDFGTGYASLGVLSRFDFDTLKIDRSFVSSLFTAGRSRAVLQVMLQLGRSLGVATTAEGVETEAQRAWLAAEGCVHAQGYLFGKPEPLAADACSPSSATTAANVPAASHEPLLIGDGPG